VRAIPEGFPDNDCQRIVRVRQPLITTAQEWFNQATDKRYHRHDTWGSKNSQEGYVYLFEHQGVYKIGHSIDPDDRLRCLGIKFPYPVREIARLYTNDMKWQESRLHKEFAHKRVGGEWFELDEDDVSFLKTLAEEVDRRAEDGEDRWLLRVIPPDDDPGWERVADGIWYYNPFEQAEDGTWHYREDPEQEEFYILDVSWDWE
jgi:T5orf172 domain